MPGLLPGGVGFRCVLGHTESDMYLKRKKKIREREIKDRVEKKEKKTMPPTRSAGSGICKYQLTVLQRVHMLHGSAEEYFSDSATVRTPGLFEGAWEQKLTSVWQNLKMWTLWPLTCGVARNKINKYINKGTVIVIGWLEIMQRYLDMCHHTVNTDGFRQHSIWATWLLSDQIWQWDIFCINQKALTDTKDR